MVDTQYDRDVLAERRGQVARDLAELEAQAIDGEVEPATAERLRGVYETELREIDEALAGIEATTPIEDAEEETDLDPPDVHGASEVARRGAGFSMKAAVGAAALLTAVTGLIVWAGTGFGSDDAETAVSGSSVTIPAGEIDIAAMSTTALEAFLVEFPDSVTVSLVLADRHLEAGDIEGALGHYIAVADDSSASSIERSRALARIGYMSYAEGEIDIARQALEESLEFNEGNTEADLYLGYVLLNGFGDAEAAIPYLERALADHAMPADVVEDIEQLLTEARASGGG